MIDKWLSGGIEEIIACLTTLPNDLLRPPIYKHQEYGDEEEYVQLAGMQSSLLYFCPPKFARGGTKDKLT